ncbi:A/G-specific adenine glycosylase [Helicobacter sp. 11S03491-1]|nr:A/G-specific adenine glycosylase [Helicobacter sp. 11S03491-1]
MHAEILQWYHLYGRKELPWRNLKGENAPYGVYVSEIMLQQTQVATVLSKYYEPFLKAFPTLETLSLAAEEEVLYLWRGLGYYSRARNMLKSAKICQKYLPGDPKELMKLPGIGNYTARAIACFGFGRAVGFVDGNIKRLLLRFFALKDPSMNELQTYAQEILNFQDSFNHNQALLDIGATLCTPLSPKCVLCPLEKWCQGKDNPPEYTQKSKIIYESMTLNLGVCICDDKIGLLKSKLSSYKGLYNFPKILETGLIDLPLIGSLRHSYTHYRLRLEVYWVCEIRHLEEGIEFFTSEEIQTLPISGMTLKILKLLEKNNLWR